MLANYIEVFNCPQVLMDKLYGSSNSNCQRLLSKYSVRPMAFESFHKENKNTNKGGKWKESETGSRPLNKWTSQFEGQRVEPTKFKNSRKEKTETEDVIKVPTNLSPQE